MRRRSMMSSNIAWEWTPDKGLSDITIIASTGETPNYQLLQDALRLYGPNNAQAKWTGVGLPDNLDLEDFTVEVYYKNLTRQTEGSIAIIAATNGAGPTSGYFGYASYYVRATNYSGIPIVTTLRGTTTTTVEQSGIPQLSGVVKVHLDRNTPLLNASYPGGYTLSSTPGTATAASSRIAAVETNRTTYYADITRIVIRRGDTT